jgi:hypothetical protein
MGASIFYIRERCRGVKDLAFLGHEPIIAPFGELNPITCPEF